jgi:voltage-dependent calcium channel L type alpha-1D
MDIVTTFFFTIEVIVKVIAVGFVINGKTSYIRDTWNMLDFIIVIISIVSLFPIEAKISVFKIIRMARLLRPLRIISKN